MSGELVQFYAIDTVKADFEEPGSEDVLRKVIGDLGGVVREEEVRSKYATLCSEQLAAIENEQ